MQNILHLHTRAIVISDNVLMSHLIDSRAMMDSIRLRRTFRYGRKKNVIITIIREKLENKIYIPHHDYFDTTS